MDLPLISSGVAGGGARTAATGGATATAVACGVCDLGAATGGGATGGGAGESSSHDGVSSSICAIVGDYS